MSYKTLATVLSAALLSHTAIAEDERLFPLGNAELAEQGIELPLPFGVSVLYNRMEDDTKISNFRIQGVGEVDKVDFRGSESKTDVYNLRLDMWLLPFLNVYALGGYLEGESTTDIAIDRRFSPNDFTVESKESYNGTNLGVGATFVYAHKQWVGSLDINYTETDLNITDSDIKSLMITPRIGYMTRFGEVPATISLGASYMDIEQTLTIKEPVPGSSETLVINMDIEGQKQWNTVVTGAFELSKQWHLVTEVGFNDRQSYLLQLNYRF